MDRQFFAQPVFDGFHIVICSGFDGLDSERIVFTKICVERVQLRDSGGGERRDFGNISLSTECFEPFDFDQHAKADQAEFAKVAAQSIYLAVVASIQRGEGGEFGECSHGQNRGNAKARILRESVIDRKSTRLNSSHLVISYAVFCLKKKKTKTHNAVVEPAESIQICAYALATNT